MMNVGDFRSDTVTKPTDNMREACKNAIVGDDVIGDDPTVKELENMCASLLGKESALFVPSGTMSNLLAVLVHVHASSICGGKAVILGDRSHMHLYEQGGLSFVAGAHACVKSNQSDGTIDLKEIENELRAHTNVTNSHYYQVAMICIENTHNQCGGRVLSNEYMNKLGYLAKQYNVPLHVDGARLLNAAVALKVNPKQLVSNADTISMCLSKSIGSPIGSILAGNKDTINNARRFRKMIGGSMRQVGIIAAPAIVALNDAIERITADHIRAQYLFRQLLSIDYVESVTNEVDSNLVFIRVPEDHIDNIIDTLKKSNILVSPAGIGILRFAVHHQINDDHVTAVIKCMSSYKIN